MFLDDELEQIYKDNSNDTKLCVYLFDAMLNKLPKEVSYKGVDIFLSSLKQIDGSWKLFCKRHSEFKEEAFRTFVLKKDVDGKFKRALNW